MDDFEQAPDPRHFLNQIDGSDEMYLHHSDHPSYILATNKLNDRNYHQWKRSVELSLSAKNKLGFVTDECSKPAAGTQLAHQWERCNNMVISWLLHSIDKEIAESVLYFRTAALIWKELATRFGRPHRTRLYQVQRELSFLCQGNLPVKAFFTKCKRIWDEYQMLVEDKIYECGSNASITSLLEEQQIVQFLMGLNDSFAAARAQIMMMDTPQPLATRMHNIYMTLN